MVRVWFITGASSSLGRALIKVILRNGDIAVATLRNPSDLADLSTPANADRLLVLIGDVTQPEDISAVFTKTIEAFGHCDIVFNSAGRGLISEAESTTEKEARKMFEVNFWGAANVSREAIRVFREANPPGCGGRLLNVSSGAGFVGGPAVGYYSARSLEGLTESLAKEMNPAWNVKISILEPGQFAVHPRTRNNVVLPTIPAYKDPALPSQKMRQWFAAAPMVDDVNLVAERIFEFAGIVEPPLRWPIGAATVAGIRMKVNHVAEELDAFESWSNDLTVRRTQSDSRS
ncbi:NAD(P)-binding protein [Crucibulum laeve]|uniref:NAD(P)-binding protein n=1 Tax=Crucibulum laeve TaxID=68775 RepID=A0A5C3MH24_9AGAR|nr:NAD(P)-binding protein [Crucibulum laeve]